MGKNRASQRRSLFRHSKSSASSVLLVSSLFSQNIHNVLSPNNTKRFHFGLSGQQHPRILALLGRWGTIFAPFAPSYCSSLSPSSSDFISSPPSLVKKLNSSPPPSSSPPESSSQLQKSGCGRATSSRRSLGRGPCLSSSSSSAPRGLGCG